MKIDSDQLTLGEFLKMDPATERFVDNAAADKLLTRNYRAPFVVPEKSRRSAPREGSRPVIVIVL